MGSETQFVSPTAGGFADDAYETLICDVPLPYVARITLNRPASMNAYTFTMCGDLQAAIARFRDDDDLRTLAFAEALAAKAPLAVRLSKMMMVKAMETSFEASLVDAQVAVMVTNPSENVREGIAAFWEKRAPKFKGR